MGDDEVGAGPDPLPPLATLLVTLAEGADGVHGSRLWAGLRGLLASPADTGRSGLTELDALRHAPRDTALAVALASIIEERAAADPALFGAKLDQWRRQDRLDADLEIAAGFDHGLVATRVIVRTREAPLTR